MFGWYLISRKQFMREIHEINPTQNLRLLQYSETESYNQMCNSKVEFIILSHSTIEASRSWLERQFVLNAIYLNL